MWYNGRVNFEKFLGDVLAFDRMFGEDILRVRALFPVINEQNKLNANDNVIVGNFAPRYALAA